jgi:hypothetical protein
MEESGEDDGSFEGEWGGLGFGTGWESSSSFPQIGDGRQAEWDPEPEPEPGPELEPGTRRGGTFSIWKDPARKREMRDEEDFASSHPLWTDADEEEGMDREYSSSSSSPFSRVEEERYAEPGKRRGGFNIWKDPARRREKGDEDDFALSNSLWTDADEGEGTGQESSPSSSPVGQDEEEWQAEAEAGTGEDAEDITSWDPWTDVDYEGEWTARETSRSSSPVGRMKRRKTGISVEYWEPDNMPMWSDEDEATLAEIEREVTGIGIEREEEERPLGEHAVDKDKHP